MASGTYPQKAQVTAAVRVDVAGLEDGLALNFPSRGGAGDDHNGSEGHNSDNGGSEELHFIQARIKRGAS